MKWLRHIAAGLLVVAVTLAVAAITGGQMGLFTGSRPADLGVRDGKLRGGDWKPNWVSSQVPSSDAKHFIEPLRFQGAPAAAWANLDKAIRATPGAAIVKSDPGYLHVEFASKALGFVDDAEFALDPVSSVIHVRSGARLGVRDFDVNRKRVETLRAGLAR